MPDAMIRAEGLVKIYKTKQTEVLALQGNHQGAVEHVRYLEEIGCLVH